MLLVKKFTGPFAISAAIALAGLGITLSAQAAPLSQIHPAVGESQPQTGPEDSAPPRIDPAAQALLTQVETAYADLKSASISGTVVLQVDLEGTSRKSVQPFTSSFERPNKFRHQLKNIMLNCDGAHGYAFDEKERAYLKFDLPPQKQHLGDLPDVVPQVLQMQNPSLLFALTTAPMADLAQDFHAVSKLPDREVDGVKYAVLQFGSPDMPHKIELLIDPKTHLIRRFVLDFTPALAENAGKKVKSATLSVDYTKITANPAIGSQQFAWSPPADALDMKEAAGAQNKEQQDEQNKDKQDTQQPEQKDQ